MKQGQFDTVFSISDRLVGGQHPCFIIAEAGISHFGDIQKALKLVDVAVSAKADAVKFQIFKSTELISKQSQDWIERLSSREMSIDDYAKVKEYADSKGILFFLTAHDVPSLHETKKLDLPCYKIGSGEVGNPSFFKEVGRIGKPVIFSTGMYEEPDIFLALDSLQSVGCREVGLLHCVTSYPTPVQDINLSKLTLLESMFEGPVGYSDHAETWDIAASSVLLGAKIIEKHITLERDIPNAQDWKVSCMPDELIEFVASVRRLEQSLGSASAGLSDNEKDSIVWARKSIVAANPINEGQVIKKIDYHLEHDSQSKFV